MVQDIQSAKDIDLICFKTFPIKATTCLQTGPCPWIGLWILLQDSINPDLLSLLKFPTTNTNEALFQLPHVPVGDRMLFNHHPRYDSALQVGMDVAISLPGSAVYYLEHQGVSLDQFFASRRTENSNSNISRSYLTTTTFYVSQEVHGRDESFVMVIDGRRENLRHVANTEWVELAFQRIDIVIVNVHCEPELTLRQLRERLHLINPHWPSCLNAAGIILGDFNICDPEEGRFNVQNQTFTDCDPRKTAMFHSFFFHTSLRLLNLITRGGDSTALGILRTLSRIDRFFINLPVAEARDFHYSHVFDNLENRTVPSDHAAVRLVIPCWMSKHPVFCSLLKRLHDDHRFL